MAIKMPYQENNRSLSGEYWKVSRQMVSSKPLEDDNTKTGDGVNVTVSLWIDKPDSRVNPALVSKDFAIDGQYTETLGISLKAWVYTQLQAGNYQRERDQPHFFEGAIAV